MNSGADDEFNTRAMCLMLSFRKLLYVLDTCTMKTSCDLNLGTGFSKRFSRKCVTASFRMSDTTSGRQSYTKRSKTENKPKLCRSNLWQKGVETSPLHLNLEFDHLLLSNHSYVTLELLKQFDLCGVVVYHH
jgi:hypothetical protein